jgi:hypothetical protein
VAKKSFKVSFDVMSTHTFVVPDCNTAEEAESIAEDWFADGEEGVIEDTDISNVDVVEDTEDDVA